MYSDNRINGKKQESYTFPSTGHVKTYSRNGINHNQKTEGINHQTHPDRLVHRQRDNFGR